MSDFAFEERPPSDIWTLPPAPPTPTSRIPPAPAGGKVGLGATDLPAPAEALSVVAEPWVEPALEPAPPPLVVAPPAAPVEAAPVEAAPVPNDADAWEAPTVPELRIAPGVPAPAPTPAPTPPPSVEKEPGEVKPTQIPFDGAPIEAPVPGAVHEVSLEPGPTDAIPTLAPPAPAPSDLIVAPEGAPAPAPADPGLSTVQLGDPRPEDAWKGAAAANEAAPDLTVTKPVDPAAVEADSLRRINQLLNASRLGLDDRASMLNALRGADVGVMRTLFAEQTGQDLDRWVSDAVSGGVQTPEAERLNHAEADALLSGDKELAVTAAVQNCGVGDKAKLTAIIASLPKTATGQPDPQLLEQLRIEWAAQHEGDNFEARLSPVDAKLLLEGEAGEAKGLQMAGARGDEKNMVNLLRSAKDPIEREDMLRAYAQNKGLSDADPEEVLAAFKNDVGEFASGAEADLLVALAEGNQAEAAAASLQVAYNGDDLGGMNDAMTSGPSPNEPGITPDEREARLEQHEANQEALEKAWFEKYGDKEEGAPPPDEQFKAMMTDAASCGKDPELEEQRLAASRGEGGMPLTMQVEYAVKTNDLAGVKVLMTGLDKQSIDVLDQFAAQTCDGKTLSDVVQGAGGADGAAVKLMYEFGDKPATPKDQIDKAKAMCAQARGSLGSKAVALVSGASDRMDSNLATIDHLEAKLQEGELTADEQAQLDRTVALIEGDVQGFKADRDTAAGYAGMAAGSAVSLGAGAVATAATGGMAPLVAAAVKTAIGTAASTATKLAVNKTFQGDEYTGKKAAVDALKGAVGGAVSFGMGASGANTAISDLAEKLPGDSEILEKGFEAAAGTAIKKPINDAAAVVLGDTAPTASAEAKAVGTSAAQAGGQAAGSELTTELLEEMKKLLVP